MIDVVFVMLLVFFFFSFFTIFEECPTLLHPFAYLNLSQANMGDVGESLFGLFVRVVDYYKCVCKMLHVTFHAW